MVKETKKSEKKLGSNKTDKDSNACADHFCPIHGINKLKLRGRTFEGKVTKKHHGRIVIEFERVLYIPKYERYEKRKTRLHARMSDCMKDKVQIGDLVEIAECRPLSKIIHCVVTKRIKSAEESK
jgi:small subunit ribosomal protein S17